MTEEKKPRLVTDGDIPSNITEQIELFEALSKRFDTQLLSMREMFEMRLQVMESMFTSQLETLTAMVAEVRDNHCTQEGTFEDIEEALEERTTTMNRLKDRIKKIEDSKGKLGWKILAWVVSGLVVSATVVFGGGQIWHTVTTNNTEINTLRTSDKVQDKDITDNKAEIRSIRLVSNENKSNIIENAKTLTRVSNEISSLKSSLSNHTHQRNRR